jgi:hypothetical protein
VGTGGEVDGQMAQGGPFIGVLLWGGKTGCRKELGARRGGGCHGNGQWRVSARQARRCRVAGVGWCDLGPESVGSGLSTCSLSEQVNRGTVVVAKRRVQSMVGRQRRAHGRGQLSLERLTWIGRSWGSEWASRNGLSFVARRGWDLRGEAHARSQRCGGDGLGEEPPDKWAALREDAGRQVGRASVWAHAALTWREGVA